MLKNWQNQKKACEEQWTKFMEIYQCFEISIELNKANGQTVRYTQ